MPPTTSTTSTTTTTTTPLPFFDKFDDDSSDDDDDDEDGGPFDIQAGSIDETAPAAIIYTEQPPRREIMDQKVAPPKATMVCFYNLSVSNIMYA